MKVKDGLLADLLMEFSLDFITQTIGVADEESGKLDLDYKILRKEIQDWTDEERKDIITYTKRDVELTKKLYEWVEEFFSISKDFLVKEDVEKKRYLTDSIAKVTYKAICKAMNVIPKYGKTYVSDEHALGGYVAYPKEEMVKDTIYCLDWNSLYPHAIIQANLLGRQKTNDERMVWQGGGKWFTHGKYYSDKLSPMGELLRQWYKQRLEYKKVGDRREYMIKIFLNTISGLMENPYYELVYDMIARKDCTGLGRQWTIYARKRFRDEGYNVIYTDTDSVYVVDVYNDKDKILKLKDSIAEEIKSTLPFPQETFGLGVDDEIKYMFFFKGKQQEAKKFEKNDFMEDSDDMINRMKGLMKKNYIYVTQEGKVKVKNLGIRKKSITPLTKKIFWEYLVPQIKEKGEIKFNKTYLYNLIQKLLQEDITLVALRKSVGPYEEYEKTSPTGIQAQIAKQYGSGIHFLIPNTANIGVGKGRKLCTLEEFKRYKLNLGHVDLTNVWKELGYFIKPIVTKNIFDFEEK